jgi:hypothetical protein
MVYTKFTPDTPIITDTGAEVIDDTRNNLMALRDAIVAGALVDWWMTPSGGTAEEPAQIIYGWVADNNCLCVCARLPNPCWWVGHNRNGNHDV